MRNYAKTYEAAIAYLSKNYGFDGSFSWSSAGNYQSGFAGNTRFECFNATCTCGETEGIRVYEGGGQECTETIVICEACYNEAANAEKI